MSSSANFSPSPPPSRLPSGLLPFPHSLFHQADVFSPSHHSKDVPNMFHFGDVSVNHHPDTPPVPMVIPMVYLYPLPSQDQGKVVPFYVSGYINLIIIIIISRHTSTVNKFRRHAYLHTNKLLVTLTPCFRLNMWWQNLSLFFCLFSNRIRAQKRLLHFKKK